METIAGRQVYTRLDEMIAPEHTALLVVDMQHDYVSPGGATDQRPRTPTDMVATSAEMLPRLQTLIERARARCALVVYIHQTQLPELRNESPNWMHLLYWRLGQSPDRDRCRLGTWGGEIIPEFAPGPNDLVIRKYRASAFVGTNLDLVLRSNRIQTIVVTGVATDGCVFATSMFGMYHDYYVVLVEDCVAASDRERHDAALQFLSTWLNAVTPSDEILRVWQAAAPAATTPARAL
jgi:nicotinamidase-related amidase